MYQVAERYADKLPRADRQPIGDHLTNDTGQRLNYGDVVLIDPSNATAGVSKVEISGLQSWRFRASLMTASGQKAGKIRVVVSKEPVDPGGEVRVVGREGAIAHVSTRAAAGATLAAGASLCAVNGAPAAQSDLDSGFAGSRIFARTMQEEPFAAGVTQKLVLCEIDGERGFGVN